MLLLSLRSGMLAFRCGYIGRLGRINFLRMSSWPKLMHGDVERSSKTPI